MNRIFRTILAIALGAATMASTADVSFARTKSQYCRAVARQEAYRASNNAVGTGIAAGAATGGVFGAITGGGRGSNIVTGLALGAVGGGLLGAASSSSHRDAVYRRVYQECMYN